MNDSSERNRRSGRAYRRGCRSDNRRATHVEGHHRSSDNRRVIGSRDEFDRIGSGHHVRRSRRGSLLQGNRTPDATVLVVGTRSSRSLLTTRAVGGRAVGGRAVGGRISLLRVVMAATRMTTCSRGRRFGGLDALKRVMQQPVSGRVEARDAKLSQRQDHCTDANHCRRHCTHQKKPTNPNRRLYASGADVTGEVLGSQRFFGNP